MHGEKENTFQTTVSFTTLENTLSTLMVLILLVSLMTKRCVLHVLFVSGFRFVLMCTCTI